MMECVYVCPKCGYRSQQAGFCPNCDEMLIATCPVCGNPIVGEHICLED